MAPIEFQDLGARTFAVRWVLRYGADGIFQIPPDWPRNAVEADINAGLLQVIL